MPPVSSLGNCVGFSAKYIPVNGAGPAVVFEGLAGHVWHGVREVRVSLKMVSLSGFQTTKYDVVLSAQELWDD